MEKGEGDLVPIMERKFLRSHSPQCHCPGPAPKVPQDCRASLRRFVEFLRSQRQIEESVVKAGPQQFLDLVGSVAPCDHASCVDRVPGSFLWRASRRVGRKSHHRRTLDRNLAPIVGSHTSERRDLPHIGKEPGNELTSKLKQHEAT